MDHGWVSVQNLLVTEDSLSIFGKEKKMPQAKDH